MEYDNFSVDKSKWKPVRLGSLVVEISERVDNPSELGVERFVGLEHFVSGDLKIKAWATTSNLTSSTKAFRSGDILLARRNAYLRRASLVDFDGVCSGDAFVLRENHEKLVPGFLAFIVNSNKLWDFANENAAGTMSTRVKWRDLANYEFLLPPKEQQAELAELLWAMDEVIEKDLAVLNKLNVMINSHTEHFFLKNESSQLLDLESVADIRYGITLNSKRKAYPIQVPYLRVANVGRGSIDISELKCIGSTEDELLRYKLEIDDVVIVEGHADILQIGRASIWKLPTTPMLHQNHLIRVRCHAKVLPDVLVAYINCSKGQSYFQGNSKSTSGLNTINSTVVKKFKVPDIDLSSQNEFIKENETLSIQIAAQNTRVSASKALLKALINEIF